MNVLIVGRAFANQKNPVGNFEYDQALALKKAGHDVTILAIDVRTVFHSKRLFNFKVIQDDIECYIVPLDIRFIPRFVRFKIGSIALYFRAKKIFQRNTFDILHVHWGPYAFLLSKLKRKFSKCVILTEHCSLVNNPNPTSQYFRNAKKGYFFSDRLLCVSNVLKNNLLKSTGLQFDVVPNVLDPKIFNESFSIPNQHAKTFELISVGHLIETKNFDSLITCFADDAFSSFRLKIYGNGKKKQELNKLIHDLDLNDRVRLMGNVSRSVLVEALKKADAFVSFSKTETFGVAFIEAMACGCPVFSLKCGGTDDIITNNNLGIICNSFNKSVVKNELNAFLSKIDFYDRHYISDFTLNHFSSNTIADILSKVYRQMINEGDLYD